MWANFRQWVIKRLKAVDLADAHKLAEVQGIHASGVIWIDAGKGAIRIPVWQLREQSPGLYFWDHRSTDEVDQRLIKRQAPISHLEQSTGICEGF